LFQEKNLYINKKDIIFAHTMISNYKNLFNFVIGSFEEALGHKLKRWNTAVFDWDGEIIKYTKGTLDFDKMVEWIDELKRGLFRE